MTDHDHQADDDAAGELARFLADLDAEDRAELEEFPELGELLERRRMTVVSRRPAVPRVEHLELAEAMAEHAGIDPWAADTGDTRTEWRTVAELVEDVDGIPAGVLEHRRQAVITNIARRRP